MNFFVMSDDGQEVISEIGEVSSVEIHSSFDEAVEDDDILLKKLEEVFSSVDIEKEKLPKPCKSIGEPHTKPLCRQFKDHRNSRKYWRR